jgi:hypothetical protein
LLFCVKFFWKIFYPNFHPTVVKADH